MDEPDADDAEPLGLRFLFDCGRLTPEQVDSIVLQQEEITRYRFVDMATAITKLRPAVARRVEAATNASTCVYLENGRPVDGVR